MNNAEDKTTKPLSEREIEVARVAANGLSNEEIGTVLGIDPQTVKVHLRSVFKKMGIARRNMLLYSFPPQRNFVGNVPDIPAQRDLLNMIADGLTDQQIADSFSRSLNEINAEVAKLRTTTGLQSRSEIAMWWMVHLGKVTPSKDTFPDEQRALLEARKTK